MRTYGKSVRTFLFATGALALTSLAACSDNPSSGDQSTMRMESQLEKSSVTLAKSVATSSNSTVDSIKVNRVRLFVRRMKLHTDSQDTSGEKTLKTDPFVITFQGQATTVADFSVPEGTYDKVKFEFHRPEESQVTAYLGIPAFVDFVTNGRSSVIYDVTLYKAGVAVDATYRSDMTANLSLKFNDPITLNAGSTSVVALKLDPAVVFSDDGDVLDPRDDRNESKIDNNIKAAIRAQKK